MSTITTSRIKNGYNVIFDGTCIATLFDGQDEFIFDPLADIFAVFGLEPGRANKAYFESVGITVDSVRNNKMTKIRSSR